MWFCMTDYLGNIRARCCPVPIGLTNEEFSHTLYSLLAFWRSIRKAESNPKQPLLLVC